MLSILGRERLGTTNSRSHKTKSKMVFTAPQKTAFFENANQMGLSHRTRVHLQREGIVQVRDLLDFADFRRTFGKSASESGYLGAFDSEGDNAIGLLDFAAFRRNFGT